MPHSNLEVAIPWGAEGELVWCCLEMAGPEGQSSSAGADVKEEPKLNLAHLCTCY